MQWAAETNGETVMATKDYRINALGKAEIYPHRFTAELQNHFQRDELIFTNSHFLCSQ